MATSDIEASKMTSIHVNAAKQCGNGQDHIKAACQEKPGQDTKHQADKNCAGYVLLIPCKEWLFCAEVEVFSCPVLPKGI